MITKLMEGLPNQSMAQVPFDEAVAKYMAELPLRGAEENALLADVKSKQVLVNESAASAAESVNAAATQAAAAQAARDAAIEARNAAQAAASDAHEAATGTVLTGTSTTPLVIGTGNKTLATQAGKQYAANIFITAVSASDPTRFMSGTVASYAGTALTIAVTAVGGNGDTKSDWNISVTGAPGAAASAALKGNATGAIELLKGTAPAASATPDIWAAGGNRVPISSGTTITGFPAAPQAGAQRTLVATVAFAIANGANLVIAGGSTTLAVGDELDITAETPILFKAWVRRVTSASGATTGDTLTTARVMPAPDWLKCDGSDYLASSYPALAGALGSARYFSKLPDPASLMPGGSSGLAYSADGVYLAVIHGNAPYVSAYKLTAGVYVKLAALATTGSVTKFLALSPDGVYLLVATALTPYLHYYKRTGDVFNKITLPSTLAGQASSGIASLVYSNDGVYLAIVSGGNTFIYKSSGDVFSPSIYLSDNPTSGQCGAFSPDGTHFILGVAETAAPYVRAYKRNGDTFNSIPFAEQPVYYPLHMAYSPDGKYLAMGLFTGMGPGMAIFKRSVDTYAKLVAPYGAPEGYGVSVSFNSDSTQLAVNTDAAPYLKVFRRVGDQFVIRGDLPVTGITQNFSSRPGVVFSPVGYDLACASLASPYLAVLRETVDPTRVRVPNLPAADTLVASYIKT